MLRTMIRLVTCAVVLGASSLPLLAQASDDHGPALAAVDDRFVTGDGADVEIPAEDITQNDIGAPTDPNALVLVAPPTHGTVIAGSKFRYVPPTDFAGFDSFTYTWRSEATGRWMSPATVTIKVMPRFLPISGFFDSDATGDLGMFESNESVFVLCDGSVGTLACKYYQTPMSLVGWTAVYGDWNGDGLTDVGGHNPATGEIVRLYRQNNDLLLDVWDSYTWVPTGAGPWLDAFAGDWNGDGKWAVALYDSAAERVHVSSEDQEPAQATYDFSIGIAGLQPLAGDWNADGTVTTGFFDAQASTYYLSNDNAAVDTNGIAVGGKPTDRAVAIRHARLAATRTGTLDGIVAPQGLIDVTLFEPGPIASSNFEVTNVAQIPPCPNGDPGPGTDDDD